MDHGQGVPPEAGAMHLTLCYQELTASEEKEQTKQIQEQNICGHCASTLQQNASPGSVRMCSFVFPTQRTGRSNGEIIGGWERPCTGTHVGHRLAVVPEALSAGGRAHWPTAVHRQLGILFFWFGPASFSALGGCCVPGAMEQIDTVEGHHVATMLVSCESSPSLTPMRAAPGPQQPRQPIPGCSPLPPVTFDAPTFWVAKRKNRFESATINELISLRKTDEVLDFLHSMDGPGGST
ncbi:hypothetical protein EDB83DRAFT_2314078 [Lactarius deliciosus]|nr:hypothetical protein EDB83DRAFT_2314078 [Lactarius deliciosus]